jgi:hypothetical protein
MINNQAMKVSVFDTYVLKSNGDTAHFDILVPADKHSLEEVIAFGKKYLHSLGEGNQSISAAECQFCHIEEPTQAVLDGISQQGFYILEMDTIPKELPSAPTRRQLIEHIRANSSELRFADLRGKDEGVLRGVIDSLR